MRKKIALAGLGVAVAATFAPLSTASAVCWPDLSPVGGPSCPSLCPGILIELTDRYVSDGFIRCAA